MTSEGDDLARALSAALRSRAQQELPELIEEAWTRARAEVVDALAAEARSLLLAELAGNRNAPSAGAVVPTGPGAEPSDEADRSADGDRACYAYGVVTAGTQPPATNGLGVRGSLRVVEEGQLGAIVSDVDPASFDEDHLKERAWVEDGVRTHDEVLRLAMEGGPVVPMRFGTIVPGEAEIRKLLAAGGDRLRAALTRFSGAAEWGVKAAWPGAELHAWVVGQNQELQELDAELGAAGEGTSYMLRRQRDQEVARHAEQVRDALVGSCHERLAAEAEDAVLFSPQRQGDEHELVLNATYLVSEVDTFQALVQQLSEQHADAGLTFQVTGPWPPYSFAGDIGGDGAS